MRAREGNAHAIEKIDDRRRHFAHGFGRRLVREKVAAVNRVVEMFPGRIAFAFGVDRAVDAALSANRMRALHRNDRKKIDRVTRLGNPHCRRQTGEAAADDRDLDSVTRHRLENSSQQSARTNECHRRVDANQQQKHAKADAGITRQSLRALANRDAPVNQE